MTQAVYSAGFTLSEVMIALLIMSMLSLGLQYQHITWLDAATENRTRRMALILAENKLDEIEFGVSNDTQNKRYGSFVLPASKKHAALSIHWHINSAESGVKQATVKINWQRRSKTQQLELARWLAD